MRHHYKIVGWNEKGRAIFARASLIDIMSNLFTDRPLLITLEEKRLSSDGIYN